MRVRERGKPGVLEHVGDMGFVCGGGVRVRRSFLRAVSRPGVFSGVGGARVGTVVSF